MSVLGADPSDLDHLARSFDGEAEKLRRVIARTTSATTSTWWVGPDAASHSARWRIDSGRLATIADELALAARSLRGQATQQRRASAPSALITSPSLPPLPLGPTSAMPEPSPEPGPPVPQPPHPPSPPRSPGDESPYSYDMALDIMPPVGGEPVDGDQLFTFWMGNLSRMFLPGAPDNPKTGDRFDLMGGNPVEVVDVGTRHFTLRSLPGHTEGADNVITFTISEDGETLSISARGPTDRGVVGEGVIPTALWNAIAAHFQTVRIVTSGV